MDRERTRRLAAVWFADIVGYTELSSRDEEAALKAVDALQRLSKESVEAHGGHIVKHIGDAVLTVFDSADAAVRSALELQEGFAALGMEECGLRVGVHLGEVVEADDGDIYGDGVNIASRIDGQAEAGQVVVSEDVYRALRQQADHSFAPVGSAKLKGLHAPMPLYVAGQGPDVPRPPRVTLSRSRALAVGISAGIVAFLILGTTVANVLRQSGSVAGVRSIVVMPVTVFQFDSVEQIAEFSFGLQQLLAVELGVDGEVGVVEAREVNRAIRASGLADQGPIQEDQASRLAQDLEADYVVRGEATEIASRVRMEFALIDVESGVVLGTSQATGTDNELFSLIRGVAAELLDVIGVSVVEPESIDPAVAEAVRLYGDAVVSERSGDIDSAITILDGVIERSPDYQLARDFRELLRGTQGR